MLTQKGVFKEAEELYLKLYDENPEEYLLLSSIGLFYVTLKDYEKASEFLEKACSIKETLGTVSALGFAEYERGNYRKSAGILIHSLTLGENPEIYNGLRLN
jgi:tetratricopeptide (TPR) repeat protein